ncbi:MAG: hypothetical protein TEF_01845 [Rhizobiales bacterium NRL2]|jgi:GMP synthase-like glutamine amidotransferase|nr:MAG: hypothetical protein TEF_01845 [Rhizobiales bacterium NRL2]
MRIGILEAGLVHDDLVDVYGDFPAMFRRWLTPHLPAADFRTWSVIRGDWPDGPRDCDAWVHTGSRFGVYDDEPWIAPLKDFIRAAAEAGVPQLGICFGHQLAAEALGGRAEKSPKGWGAGLHRYRIALDGAEREFPMIVSHQDQVTAVPPGARALGGNDHCPFGVLEYRDVPILTAQFHPEFNRAFSAALIRLRAGSSIPERVAAPALASLATPPANAEAGRWMAGWLKAKLEG